jgi:hypothetical protein
MNPETLSKTEEKHFVCGAYQICSINMIEEQATSYPKSVDKFDN